ncbi:MAG: Yip1 family protein [Burkholderiaceae bacterium]|nr:Yip1 family protein [Burkholderiaceae bacterium]
MNLVDRAKKIILTPQAEWEVINQESTSTSQLYTQYIVLLAAIGPVAMFLGGSFLGFGFFSLYGIVHSLVAAVFSYVLGLVGVFLVALIIDALAPSFGAQKNQLQALKVAAYSFTPAWLAGIFHLVPLLGILGLLAFAYTVYLMYLGLPVLMKTTKEKAVGYTAVVFVCAFVIFAVFGFIGTGVAGVVGGLSLWGHRSEISITDSSGTTTVNVDGLKQLGANMEAASKQMEAANKSGNPQAQADAAAAAMAAMAGGTGKAVEPVDQNLLKAMLPDSIADLKRTRLEAEKAGMGNIKVSKADAGYAGDQGRSVDVTITDAGGTPMFGGLAAWAMIEQERDSDDSYEKTGKVNGRPTHEKFNKKSHDGEYSVVVAGRFIVEARGRQVDMDTLKQVVAAVGPDKLEALKNEGVKQ